MPAFGEHLKRFYPGMTPKEDPVWRAWLKDHEGEFERFMYDVHVGEGVRVPPTIGTGDAKIDEQFRALYQRATQPRIDAVGIRAGEWWAIEVEQRADARTLGQLLMYGELLPITFPEAPHIELAIVCARVGPDMLTVLETQGIAVFQVTPLAAGS